MADANSPTWLPALVEATSVLNLLLSESEYRDEVVHTHQRNNVTRNPVFCDPASSLVCQSFVMFHEYNIQRILDVRPGHCEYSDLSADFWILAGACQGGNINLVSKAVEHVQLNYTKDWKTHVSLFLGSVVPVGTEEMIRYLISLGVDANTGDEDYMTAFVSSAWYRRLDILRLLLEPQYNLSINNEKDFRYTITDVAVGLDPTVRLDTIKLLIARSGHLLSLESRSEVFYIACCYNDPTLAQLILEKGPVNVYTHHALHSELSGGTRWTAVDVVAARGYLDCLRLILQNKFTPDRHEAARCFCSSSTWRIIHRNNRIEVFKEILPYMEEKCCQRESIYLRAAQLSGGLLIVEDLKGPFDKNSQVRDDTTTLGVRALQMAAARAVVDNVQYLLEEGVRTEEEILIDHEVYKEHKDKFDRINEVLIKFGNPGLGQFNRQELGPPPWYRHFSLDYSHIN